MLCGRDAEFYCRLRLCGVDLLLACIRGNDMIEIKREGSCCLAIPGGAVPCKLMLRAQGGEVLEQ